MEIGELLAPELQSVNQHQLNRDVVGILFWLVPVLLVGLYILVVPLLSSKKIGNHSLRSYVLSAGLIFAGAIVGMTVGGFLTFGMCFDTSVSCSGFSSYGPVVIGVVVSLGLTIPYTKKTWFRYQVTQDVYTKAPSLNVGRIILGAIIVVGALLLAVGSLQSSISKLKAHELQDQQIKREFQLEDS